MDENRKEDLEREKKWDEIQKAHKKKWVKNRKNGSYLRLAHRVQRHDGSY